MTGLSEFINTIKSSKPMLPSGLIQDLENYIIESGCSKLKFEKLSDKAAGLSFYDECILNYDILNLQYEYTLYIIMHEIAHQYQYKKHGKDIALDIYKSETDVNQAVEKLLYLESEADSVAIETLNEFIAKHKIKSSVKIIPRYLNNTNTDYFKNYITKIREEVINNNYSSIDDINKYMYNRLKN